VAIVIQPLAFDNFAYIVLTALFISLVTLFLIYRKNGNLSYFNRFPVKHFLFFLFISPYIGLGILLFVENSLLESMVDLYYQIHNVIILGILVAYCIFVMNCRSGIISSLAVAAILLMLPIVIAIVGAPVVMFTSFLEGGLPFFGIIAMLRLFTFWKPFENEFSRDQETRKRIFGDYYKYNAWSIGWLLVRLGNRVNLDNDISALRALESILKMDGPVLSQAIDRVEIEIIPTDDGITVVNWKKRGEMRITSEGLLHGFGLQKYFMTNSEIREHIRRVRRLYSIECFILLILSILSFLLLTGSVQIFGVAISLSLVVISLPIMQREVTAKNKRAEAESIISFFKDALAYLDKR